MSYFICPNCGAKHYIFGEGIGRKTAEEFGLRLIAEIPINGELRRLGDNGRPIVVAEPESPEAKAFQKLVDNIEEFFAA